ncbi:uncharacterized protein LOC128983411 [Macrosteles quadrilineatus]|uniref:uncharacterized protein LOC128983411 n=1 Tax=Macrosteles quadrilineatus TaxID=74068 RepID=UPI0023E1977F|nr:uncharacterized protein LOC128983411 [Macrosteles quadrilineatus]
MGDLNVAIGRVALLASSGYSLSQCMDLKYVRVAFALYAVDGALGILDYGLPRSNEKVKKALAFVDRVSMPCYTPLVAAEAILFAGFEEKFSYCHLVFPIAYVVLTEVLKKNVPQDLVDLSVIWNSISVGFSAYKKDDILYGGLTGVYHIAAFLGFKFNSMEYFLVLSGANLLALQFFKQSLE